jgi:hypothetical protein
MKIYAVAADLFHADGRTDRQTFAFRNFTNVSNNEFFPATVVEHRTHVEAVGCRTFYDGLIDMFVFDILLIPSGGIQIYSGIIVPTCTPLAMGLNYGRIMVQIVSYRLLTADARIPLKSRRHAISSNPTTLANANRTRMINTYCEYTVLRYS